jgi:hypothetical protein
MTAAGKHPGLPNRRCKIGSPQSSGKIQRIITMMALSSNGNFGVEKWGKFFAFLTGKKSRRERIQFYGVGANF